MQSLIYKSLWPIEPNTVQAPLGLTKVILTTCIFFFLLGINLAWVYTLWKFNFRILRLLEANFVKFFAIFSKTAWNSEKRFTSLESPDIQLF